MSMQIGPMPGPPDNIALRQQETRAAVSGLQSAASTLPNRSNPVSKPVDIKTTAQELEHVSLAFNRRLKFIVDHESNQIIVKVIDNETDKVIKVLPPEELQRLHSRIRETIGFLFDKSV